MRRCAVLRGRKIANLGKIRDVNLGTIPLMRIALCGIRISFPLETNANGADYNSTQWED